MEGILFTVATKELVTQGVIGGVAVLAIVASILLYREVRDVSRRWMEDRATMSKDYQERLIAQSAVIERNTAAHLEAVKTNEARAITLQRLIDDHGKHERDLDTLRRELETLRREFEAVRDLLKGTQDLLKGINDAIARRGPQ